MYFKGILPDGREIYSDTYKDRSLNMCILTCEDSEGDYCVSKTKLSISFDGGKTWFKYAEVEKWVASQN